MNAAAVTPEGGQDLSGALARLEDAVHALIGPQSHVHDNQVRTGPSRYMMLWDATEGEQSNTGAGSGGKSRPPLWLDAFDLLREIDIAVEAWSPQPSGVPPTVGRLRTILTKKYRPQDVRAVEQITNAAQSWTAAIDELLNPTPKWTLPSPCPACSRVVVYRRDSAGELVRKPALQLDSQGCTCQNCRHTWGPELFTHLARVLGYPLPTGVLE